MEIFHSHIGRRRYSQEKFENVSSAYSFFLCNLGRDLYDPFEELLQLNPRAYALFFSRHRLGESLARRMILAIKD